MPVDFDSFVKQRTDPPRESDQTMNREKLAAWKSKLDYLYKDMEDYLREYIDSGQIKIERRPVQLTEDDLGSYEAEALAILIGKDEVIAEPVAALLIGCSGRVDLSGPWGISRIVLLEKSGPAMNVTISGTKNRKETSIRSPLRGEIEHRGWYLVTPPPAATATLLNEDSFRDAIMDVAGG